MKNLKWIVPLLLLLALGIWRGAVLLLEDTAQVAVIAPAVQVETIQEEQIQNILKFNGTVLADEDAVAGSEIAGKVQRILVKEGDSVAKGQALVLLDSSDYQASLQLAEAELQKALTALSLAQTTFEQTSALFEAGAVSSHDFDQAQAGLDVARADEQAARTGVNLAAKSVERTTVKSPINGQIYNLTVLSGQMVSPGLPLMMIADTSKVDVIFNIPQLNINELSQPGLKARVFVEGNGQPLAGTLQSVSPVATPTARAFEARLTVDNPHKLLKPGMFVQIELDTGQVKRLLTVPANAVVDIQGQHCIYVVKEGKASQKSVTTGEMVGDRVEILTEIDAAEQIIVTGVNRLRDGDAINVQS